MAMTGTLRRASMHVLLAALAGALVLGSGSGVPTGRGATLPAASADDSDAAQRRCRQQCMLYHLLWRPDSYGATCWDLMTRTCSKSEGELLLDVLEFAADVASGQLAGLDSWAEAAGCLTVLATCVADFGRACAGECGYDSLAYAPNPCVRWGSEGDRGNGLRFDEQRKVVHLVIRNTGYALCPEVEYSVSAGSTTDPDRHVTGTVVASGRTTKLAPASSLRAGPAVPPKEFTLDIPWDPPPGAYSEMLVSVDGSGLLEETREDDNLFRLRVDRLPAPCRVRIEGVDVVRPADALDRAVLVATLRNVGGESCEATWQLFADEVAPNETPLASGKSYLRPGVAMPVEIAVALDVAGGSPSGGRNARFTLRVVGDASRVHDEQAVAIPWVAGHISGRVTGRLGREVVGATVSASAGGVVLATARSGPYGFYHLGGIARLGDVHVTASHPAYTATASRTVTLTYDPAAEGPDPGLSRAGVDLVLTDTPGTLLVAVMDAATRRPLGGASWSAVSPPIRRDGAMAEDESLVRLEDLVPGQWLVTAGKPGYATATERTVLPSGQSATVTLWLEPFRPRQDDEGLGLHPPLSLWKKTLDGRVYAHASSKDGKLLVLYTADPSTAGSGRLRFLDARRGTEVAVLPMNSPKGQQQVALDVAWHADPVGFFLHEGVPGRPGPGNLAVYGPKGVERARLPSPPAQHPYVEVSPDGAWVYAWGLFDAALRGVPDHRPLDPRSYPQGWPQERYVLAEAIHFTRDGAVVGHCREGEARVCRLTLREEVLAAYAGAQPALRLMDSGGPTGSGETLLLTDDQAARRFVGTACTWTLRPQDFGLPAGHSLRWESAALSPGGDVVMLVEGRPQGRMRVFSWGPRPPGAAPGVEVTPPGIGPWVQHVAADEAGLHFLVVKGHEVEYFRMGRYGVGRPRPSGTGD